LPFITNYKFNNIAPRFIELLDIINMLNEVVLYTMCWNSSAM